MSLRNLLRMNYMTVMLMTIVLVIWVFVFFPWVFGLAGIAFNMADPYHFGFAMFSGLMFNVIVFKIMNYRKGLT